MVDEHAGELIANRFVNKNRGDGGIDAAREPANHPAVADLTADFFDRLILKGAHGPVAGTAGDVADKVAQDRGAVRRVYHFKMELGRVEFPCVVANHRNRRVGGSSDRGKASGSRVTRSPWLIHTG